MNAETQMKGPSCWKIRQKCADCVKVPKFLQTVVIVACAVIVVQQISVFIEKLIDIPITTYTHFDFNKTLVYPSVTFCREPPYKYNKMKEYGLYAHPRYTSTWRNFDYDNVSLDAMWEEITYNEQDFFVQYGLNGYRENVELTSTVGFVQGRCYTLTPKILISQASKGTGYSVTLQHTPEDIATTIGTQPPGYHIYIHYKREPFTEVTVYNGGMVDSLYVNMGETLDVKLKVDEYRMISCNVDPCSVENNYSANECTTRFVWKNAIEAAGCSGPWMLTDVPRCDNYTGMRRLITAYMNTYQSHTYAECPRVCHSLLYNGIVADRQKIYVWNSDMKRWSVNIGPAALQTHLFIYFNSMMVSVYEERYNYDWNLFVSDLGGSMGFLLGLSVLSITRIFGKTWKVFVEPFFRVKKNPKPPGSISSVDTVDVKTISQDYMDIFDTWNEKTVKK